ncbi:hypothetical protein C8R43DRAFT_277534 [Mycena crocata]|nr:hypothetical protein C8R43DRAFT_277534 [Mycena crocata]
MCETFHLEFHPDVGIVAWADGDSYDDFSGPLMQEGDLWEIMLGRRVKLDEDDADAFMEALSEDALVFPLLSTCQWETVEESPGIWVTRTTGIDLLDSSDDASSDNSSDGSPASPKGSHSARVDPMELAWELEDRALEPDYVAPILPVAADHYDPSDTESDVEGDVEMVREDSKEDGDDGWTFEANVPDSCWVSPPEEDPMFTADAPEDGAETEEITMIDESSDEDSADSDFDSDEVLSGDEFLNML